MAFRYLQIPYASTGYFSSLILDYLEEKENLRPFYQYSPIHPDFDTIIRNRRQFPVDRELLVRELQRQYQGLDTSERVKANIEQLRFPDTFTVCTAHQPNIFTGYLYVIYKLIQAIRLADDLKKKYPDLHFVPVYYMGSEDADLQELNKIRISGKTLSWETPQTGAVGRMNTEGLDRLIGEIRENIPHGEHAANLMALFENAYLQQVNIQQAFLHLVNALFGHFGLVVLIADTPAFKQQFLPVIREELFHSPSRKILGTTIESLSAQYHIQAKPREINLFYLEGQIRERLIQDKDGWRVMNTSLTFSPAALETALITHPERFSPNVILRGLLQESILPNLVFIGGGGELSYWLELKGLFDHFNIPYPLLLLRNSVCWIDPQSQSRLEKLGITPADLFLPAEQLITDFVRRNTTTGLDLIAEKEQVLQVFDQLATRAAQTDPTLVEAVHAQRAKAMKALDKVALKLLRAQKKKMLLRTDQIRAARDKLFPGNSLQERTENMIPYYVRYGPEYLDILYHALDPMSNQFLFLLES
ncbi:MAG TPA: bacillithiol biosynthesis cysteine-adding enzyme BshC [Chitinophagaceae bacterium]|nr:bacillithiol biosynthesis cysteine-adding enzyme BshC [Chitinophagaceae bacterium]